MQTPLYPGETLLISAPANLFRGIEGVSGRLHLTSLRVIFEVRSLSFQTQPEILSLEQIIEVSMGKTMGIIPNALIIRTSGGNELRFITWRRKKLLPGLQSLCPWLKK